MNTPETAYSYVCIMTDIPNRSQLGGPTRKIPGLAIKKESTRWIDPVQADSFFGVTPAQIGTKHLSHWVVDEVGPDETQAGAARGDLCIKTLDTGEVAQDLEAKSKKNFIGTSISGKDKRVRYYYFRLLSRMGAHHTPLPPPTPSA